MTPQEEFDNAPIYVVVDIPDSEECDDIGSEGVLITLICCFGHFVCRPGVKF